MSGRDDLELVDLFRILWVGLLLSALHSLGVTTWRRPVHAELIIYNVTENYLKPAQQWIGEQADSYLNAPVEGGVNRDINQEGGVSE